MKPVNLFSRRKGSEPFKDRIICENEEIEEFISDWLYWCNKEWKLADFASILAQIGVQLPVMLSKYNVAERSFQCRETMNGREFEIALITHSRESYDQIWLTSEDERYRYDLPTRSRSVVQLAGKDMVCGQKQLVCTYAKYDYYRTLRIDNTHTLEVKISNPNSRNDDLYYRNFEEVENYLLSLDNSLLAYDVCNTMLNLLHFSYKDIYASNRILVSHYETIGEEKRVLNKVLLINGEMQEYAVLEEGNAYHLYRNGDWRYSSNQALISYVKRNDQYVFSMKGSWKTVSGIDVKSLIADVEKKIFKLNKFVED
ncbi:MAG: hypothetical protein IJ217_04295 [Clostridia bacterium]|nr:hypothetical protein [Clostridia bacterium]